MTIAYGLGFDHHIECIDRIFFWCEIGKHYFRSAKKPHNYCLQDYSPGKRTDDCVCDEIETGSY